MKKYISILFLLLFASTEISAQDTLRIDAFDPIEIIDPNPLPLEPFVFNPNNVRVSEDGATIRVTLNRKDQWGNLSLIPGPITIQQFISLDPQLISVTNNGCNFDFRFAPNASDATIIRNIFITFSYEVTNGNNLPMIALGDATLKYSQPAKSDINSNGGAIDCDTIRLYQVGEQPPLIISKQPGLAMVGAEYAWEKRIGDLGIWRTMPGQTQATCIPDIMGESDVSYRRKIGIYYSNTLTLKSAGKAEEEKPLESGRVIISEIMYDTPLNEQIGLGIPYSNGEYIELYNVESFPVDLTGWKLTGGGVTEIYEIPANTVIQPGKCILIVYQYYNSGFLLRDLYQDIDNMFPNDITLYQRKIILSNSGETVSLIDPTGRIVDYITYDGTSNKSKPDRLSAPNEDGPTGWNCDALVRKEVMFDSADCAIFDPSHWGLGLSPFEVHINFSTDRPTQTENYILETTYTSPDSGNDVVTYYDGLGRTKQVIDVQASPVAQQSIVSFFEYDNMGRSDAVSYLPYAAPSQSSAIRNYPLGEQQNFYRSRYTYDHKAIDGNYGYASMEYDNSGLGIVRKQGGVGRAFQLDAHPTIYDYGFAGEWGEIRRYAVADNGDLLFRGIYEDEQVIAKATLQPTTGNQKSTTIQYYEPGGALIATEHLISGNDRRITYYVYDDLGRQRYIIPPSVNITSNTPLSQLSENCFYNEYDEFGRVYKQYVPGASYTLSIYDNWGRLAMTQNGEQRDDGMWSYIKYDVLGRPVIIGICSGGSYDTHKVGIQMHGTPYVYRNNSVHGYTNGCYPEWTDNDEVLVVSYYDDYDWVSNAHKFMPVLALHDTYNQEVKGLPTGKKVRVLNSGKLEWLTSVSYYDDKYRVIHTIEDTFPGGQEYVSNAFDYSGNVIEVRVLQSRSEDHEYRKWLNYDDYGRLLSIEQQVSGDRDNGPVSVASYTYDELGGVSEKKLHNGYETISYEYDMVGRNTRSNSSLFGYGVQTSQTSTDTAPRYDGKPVHFEWHRPSDNGRGYKFVYDNTGQIEEAQYQKYSPQRKQWERHEAFEERGIRYDKNGNITRLNRTDDDETDLHDLSYSYRGNQLSKLTFNGVEYNGFTYDLNGNLTYDPVENVHIQYNELNLPRRIFGDNGEIRYIYDAQGRKLASYTGDGSFTYYRGVMVFSGLTEQGDDNLIYMLHPEGVVARQNNRYVYNYHLTDYLGNVRTVAEADNNSRKLSPVQNTDYYPFGLAHSYNDLHRNRYLFSGKEIQDANVGSSGFLGLYDFGARYYNPVLGRWFNTDPALQTTNPYLFCGNAPMIYTDPDGRWFIVDDLLAAAIGGIFNSVSGLISGDIKSMGHFFASLGAGAAAGLVTYYAGPIVGGAFLGMTNSTLSQGFNNGWGNIHFNSVLFSGAMGGFTGGASSRISSALAPVLNKVTGNIASPVIEQAVNQGATGAVTGFVVGSGVSLIQGQSFEEAMRAGGTNALFGLTMGAINGTVSGVKYARENGIHWRTGEDLPHVPNYAPRGDGDNITLYRGMSGNEDPNKSLFMTDNPAYAKTYGSDVRKVTIDRLEFERLKYSGGVETKTGLRINNNNLKGTEYMIMNKELNTYILNNIKP